MGIGSAHEDEDNNLIKKDETVSCELHEAESLDSRSGEQEAKEKKTRDKISREKRRN